jgi:V-type H+-transporting ATPase subunit A
LIAKNYQHAHHNDFDGIMNYEDRESHFGEILAVCGPMVLAESMEEAALYELVRVGTQQLVGEIIRLEGDTATIQMYDNTSGLTVGDPVLRTGKPLSINLGPAIMESIFDDQNPLKTVTFTDSYFHSGNNLIPEIDQDKQWFFKAVNFEVGDNITGGDIYGQVGENDLLTNRILLPPRTKGEITYIAPDGHYSSKDIVLELEFNGEKSQFTMNYLWPVRLPRPFHEKLVGDCPLLSGQRVLDAFFPVVQGGICAIAGLFGCGKTVISQAICKYANTDIIIYVGEHGIETAKELREYPTCHTNKDVSIMKRTALIANSSNVAACEASIYYGITLAEYFRDMGLNVAMITEMDSLARWEHIIGEFCRLDIPMSSGYPAMLKNRLATLYERAGKVKCLGDPGRTGSVTFIGTVTSYGEFDDSNTVCNLDIVQCFIGLDKQLAQRNHFPAVSLLSWSKYVKPLEPFYEQYEFIRLRRVAREILYQQEDLNEIVLITGVDSLSESSKITLETAKRLREDFFNQNWFGGDGYDEYCPFYKTVWMLRNFIHFYESAQKAATEQQVKWEEIKSEMGHILFKLSSQKFYHPDGGVEKNVAEFQALFEEITNAFSKLLL